MSNVVQMRDHPLVTDIPGQLRQMADAFERGEMEASSILLIVPREKEWPEVYGWGEHLGDYGNVAVMELAKTWFVNNLTTR